MGRAPHLSKDGWNKGAWTPDEDKILTDYVKIHGVGKWSNVAKKTGLKRRGKSCRLRWMNYQRPDIKRGNISLDEEELIVRLHKLLGNRWSLIAGRLPGRTDNEIKNYWNSNLAKKSEDHFGLTLPKLQTQSKALHNQVPAPPPPPTAPTKPDDAIFALQPQSENHQTLQHDPTINVRHLQINNNVDASPSSISVDENYYPSDQLRDMEFNMDDFFKILDFDFSDSVPTMEEEDREVGVADVAPERLERWNGKSDECAQADEAENSDFVSLISFLDWVPLEWKEIM